MCPYIRSAVISPQHEADAKERSLGRRLGSGSPKRSPLGDRGSAVRLGDPLDKSTRATCRPRRRPPDTIPTEMARPGRQVLVYELEITSHHRDKSTAAPWISPRRPHDSWRAIPAGAQVCTALQFDWSRTRVGTATLKTFSAGLFLVFCWTSVELMSN